jgi:hypothetical protein
MDFGVSEMPPECTPHAVKCSQANSVKCIQADSEPVRDTDWCSCSEPNPKAPHLEGGRHLLHGPPLVRRQPPAALRRLVGHEGPHAPLQQGGQVVRYLEGGQDHPVVARGSTNVGSNKVKYRSIMSDNVDGMYGWQGAG